MLDAGLRDIAVCMNGAVVYDSGSDDIVSASPMTPAVMRSFVAALERHWDDFALAVERLGTSISQCWAEAGHSHPWVSEFRVADRAQLLAEPAAKLLVRSDGDSDTFAKAARETGVDDVAVTSPPATDCWRWPHRESARVRPSPGSPSPGTDRRRHHRLR